ncbi:unnamed protein product [Moneuplotes crassus]|uniref:RING-type domain-containing protein n=1 Tax=Euplotes crassus TaxID=5936 RepID=A0AAD2D1A7_EUPCR|nr:unnamed protein product [Moneuplotes crassus]
MSRAKPWRQRPTAEFMHKLDLAKRVRLYLVNMAGPTKCILQDDNRKKFKVMIGNTIECSCGGGRIEHCIHTIFTLLRIFRIQEGDPLLYQLSFIDDEIKNAVPDDPYRFHYNPSPQPVMPSQRRVVNRRAEAREAQQLINRILEEGKEMAENIRMKQLEVERMKLQEDEQCCICFEPMSGEQNLTFCKYGCGKNFHMKCADHYASHKISNKTECTCPLCRKSWGENIRERFKREARLWKEEQEKRKFEVKKNIFSKYNLNTKPHGIGSTDRSFVCYCCKRSILYDSKFQCVMCIDVEICKICYISNYHEQHKFVVRPSPDKNWKPAFRDTELKRPKRKGEENKELTLDEFETLLSVKQRDKLMTMHKFLTLSYEKMFSYPKVIPDKSTCVVCELEINQGTQAQYAQDSHKKLPKKDQHEYHSKALQLPCNHLIHKYCMEELFRKKTNRCSDCDHIILLGYQSALLSKRLVNSEVLKKKNEYEANEKIFAGNYGAIGVGADLKNIDPPKAESDGEDIDDEVVDVNIDQFLEDEIQREETKEPTRRQEDASMAISNMIAQYNAAQPDFGQKIDDPSSRRPFKIKQNRQSAYRGVASGNSVVNANRMRVEQGRRHLVQNNRRNPATEESKNRMEEEKKAPLGRPPRCNSKSKRLRQKRSMRTNNLNNSGMRDSSFASNNTSYGRINRSNRITPPCPVHIPKEVTDGIEMLRAVRLAREGHNNNLTHMTGMPEESKSPGTHTSSNNALEKSKLKTRPRSGIRIKKSKKVLKKAPKEESKIHKEQSVLSKEVKDWEITNLINQTRDNASYLTGLEERKIMHNHYEEEKVPPRARDNHSEFNFNLPSDLPPGGEERMEHLRQMEKYLFPPEQVPKKKKAGNRLKVYKRARGGSSKMNSNTSHNFTGNRIKVNKGGDTSIERYLKEIRGEEDLNDQPFLPERHANRIRGLDEQDDVFHPLLSEALALDDQGRVAEAIPSNNARSNLISSTQADSDEYVMPSKDPAKELREEIKRNKKAKARLRELQKQADLQKARQNAPLKQYYSRRN